MYSANMKNLIGIIADPDRIREGLFLGGGVDSILIAHDFPEGKARFFTPSSLWPSACSRVYIYDVENENERFCCVQTAFRNNLPAALRWQFSVGPYKTLASNLAHTFSCFFDVPDLDARIRRLYEQYLTAIKAYASPESPYAAEYSGFQNLLNELDYVTFASEYERCKFNELGLHVHNSKIIRDSVPGLCLSSQCALPDSFTRESYILCADDIEPTNNQAMLAFALRFLGIRAVFAGRIRDEAYLEQVKRLAGNKGLFAPDAGLEFLASLYRQAVLYCSPSLTGHLGRQMLLAGASGVKILASANSPIVEYFGTYANCFAPDTFSSFLDGAMLALKPPVELAPAESISSAGYTETELEHFLTFLSEFQQSTRHIEAALEANSGSCYIDVTALLYGKAPGSESFGLARLLLDLTMNQALSFICYDKTSDTFLFLDRNLVVEYVRNGVVMPDNLSKAETLAQPGRGTRFLMLADMATAELPWMDAVLGLVNSLQAKLVPIIYNFQAIALDFRDKAIWKQRYNTLLKLGKFSSCIFVPTREVALRLYKLLHEAGQSSPPIIPTSLSNGVRQSPRIEGTTGLARVKNSVGNRPYILVATNFDIKQDHMLIYRIIRKIEDVSGYGEAPLFVFAGEISESSLAYAMLANDPAISEKVLIIQDPDKAETNWLYQHCFFTVAPVVYDENGSQAFKSLSHGKVCVTSGATANVENIREFLTLIKGHDEDSWAKQIMAYMRHPERLEKKERQIHRWQTEKTGASIEVATFFNNAYLTRIWPVVGNNSVIEFGASSQDVWEYLGIGWSHVEGEGIICNGESSEIIFRFRKSDQSPCLSLWYMAESSLSFLPQLLEISINDLDWLRVDLRKLNGKVSFILPLDANEKAIYSEYRIKLIPHFLNLTRRIGEQSDKVATPSRLLISRMVCQYADIDKSSMENIVKTLDGYVSGMASLFRGILLYNPDARHLARSSSKAAERLLIWAFQYGVNNEVTLASKIGDLFTFLTSLYRKTPQSTPVAVWNDFYDLIWHLRPDLQRFSAATIEGHKRFEEWFQEYGGKEFGLEISSTEDLTNPIIGQSVMINANIHSLEQYLNDKQRIKVVNTRISLAELQSQLGIALLDSGTSKPPRLRMPTSQLLTPSQFDEGIYYQRCAEMGETRKLKRSQWARVYTVQVLNKYGLLKNGMSGIGFESADSPLPSILATKGIKTLVGIYPAPAKKTDDDNPQYMPVLQAASCPKEVFRRYVSYRYFNLHQLPFDLVGKFDFLWMGNIQNETGTLAKGLAFINHSLSLLKLGGIGIYIIKINISSNEKTIEDSGRAIFRKRDIEELHRIPNCEISPVNWNLGTSGYDAFVEFSRNCIPDYLYNVQNGFIHTYLGLIVKKL